MLKKIQTTIKLKLKRASYTSFLGEKIPSTLPLDVLHAKVAILQNAD